MKRVKRRLLLTERMELTRLQYREFIFARVTLASAGISCRRVSACPSVHPSQVGVLLKQLNVASRK